MKKTDDLLSQCEVFYALAAKLNITLDPPPPEKYEEEDDIPTPEPSGIKLKPKPLGSTNLDHEVVRYAIKSKELILELIKRLKENLGASERYNNYLVSLVKLNSFLSYIQYNFHVNKNNLEFTDKIQQDIGQFVNPLYTIEFYFDEIPEISNIAKILTGNLQSIFIIISNKFNNSERDFKDF